MPLTKSCLIWGEEEDKETLSDKEFLDDEPVHNNPQRRCPMFPEEDKTEDDLCALAAAYEDTGCEHSRAAPEELVVNTWVIPKYGLHKGCLALVLMKCKLLTAPMSSVETVGMGLMMHQQCNKCVKTSPKSARRWVTGNNLARTMVK
ncbi:hypothetical protein B0H13DRAFT_1907160 [Mycena leptocephala]|nr:hypothetical protein B0H13DRAFT_1907160 [Mycena leptocephala]